MSSIDDIPDEILSRVFYSIPVRSRKKERLNLIRVSKRWWKLVDCSVGIDVFIGAVPWAGWESATGIDHIDINRIQDIGVSSCHIGELTELDPSKEYQDNSGFLGFVWSVFDKLRMLFVSDPPFPKFKHPHLLTSLRFSGIIRTPYFQNLVTPATTYHLRQLQFNHSSLSLLDKASLQNLDLENLIYLEVMADFMYIFRNVDDSLIVDNLLTLLQNRCPRLTSCKLYIPHSSTREMETGRTVFGFLHRHASSLQYVEICYFHMLEDLDDGEDLDFGPQPEPEPADHNSSLQDSELDRIVGETAEELQLRCAILHFDSDKLGSFNSKHWSRLLSKQKGIEHLHIISQHQLFSPLLIQQISSTLRLIKATVNIRGENGEATPLDCTLFGNCEKLTHFTFQGRYEDYVLMRTSAGLINSKLLPPTLYHIDLTRIPVLTSELRIILLSFPNLRYFAGKYLGRHGDMGVTVGLLEEVIEMGQLEWFLFEGCINGPFPEDGISNGHPVRPVSLLAGEDDEYFCAKLDRSGYYAQASPFEELLANFMAAPVR